MAGYRPPNGPPVYCQSPGSSQCTTSKPVLVAQKLFKPGLIPLIPWLNWRGGGVQESTFFPDETTIALAAFGQAGVILHGTGADGVQVGVPTWKLGLPGAQQEQKSKHEFLEEGKASPSSHNNSLRKPYL